MRELLAGLALLGFALSNALETALLSLSFAEEKKLVKSLPKKGWLKGPGILLGRAFDAWRRHPTGFLTTILVINGTLSMLWCVLGLGELEIAPWAPVAVGLALFFFGELVPKVLARRFPEWAAAIFIVPFHAIFYFLGKIVKPLLYLERVTPWRLPGALRYPLTDKEIKTLLEDRELTQDLRPRSRFIVESLLDFSSRRVKEAMRPSSQVFFLDVRSASRSAVLEQLCRHPYSRIPVSSDGTLNGVTGILYVKDLLFTFATSGLLSLEDLLRPCPAIEENERLSTVLERFRREAIHLALVRDKAGHAKGIISLEDILEEMVGEIRDEHT